MICVFDKWQHSNGGCIFDNTIGDNKIHPTGGEPSYLKDEEDLLLIINNFLFMVNHDRD
jgi:hypothetical protein